MVFRQGNHKVQALAPECSQDTCAERIRHGHVHGRLQDVATQIAYAVVQSLGEDGILVMDEKPI